MTDPTITIETLLRAVEANTQQLSELQQTVTDQGEQISALTAEVDRLNALKE